jgi:hypothetical protein
MIKTVQLSRAYDVIADAAAPAFHVLPAHDLSAFHNYLARNRTGLELRFMVDVEADIGLAALSFIDLIERGRVTAIESRPERYVDLRKTLQLNGLSSRIHLVTRPEERAEALAALPAGRGFIYLPGLVAPLEQVEQALRPLVEAGAPVFFRLNIPAIEAAGSSVTELLQRAEAALGPLAMVDDLSGLVSPLDPAAGGEAQLRAIQRGPSEIFSLVSRPELAEIDPAPAWSSFEQRTIRRGKALEVRSIGDVVEDVAVLADYAHRRMTTPSRPWTKGGKAGAAELCVFTLDQALLTSCYLSIDPLRGRLFGNQTYFEPQAWFNLRPQLEAGRYEFRSAHVIPLEGRHVVIGGPIDNAYYHWLFNWAPRLVVLKALWPELYDDPELRFAIDHRARAEPYAGFLRLMGLDSARIDYLDDANDYALTQPVLVSFLAQTTYYPEVIGWFVEAIRQGSRPVDEKAPRRRVLISRRKFDTPKRRIVNLDEIAPTLAAFGVEEVVLEDLDVEAQIALFSTAELVIGVHGAGLANLIFSPPDCRVVLLENERNLDVGLAGMFSVLAGLRGLAHETVTVEEVIEPGVDYSAFGDVHNRDVKVPPHRLKAALSRLFDPTAIAGEGAT